MIRYEWHAHTTDAKLNNYGNDDDFVNYNLHLVNNDDKSAKSGLHQ